jgi:hypothetical protein
MHGVAGKPALQNKAALFQGSGRGAIVDVAGHLNAENLWQPRAMVVNAPIASTINP